MVNVEDPLSVPPIYTSHADTLNNRLEDGRDDGPAMTDDGARGDYSAECCRCRWHRHEDFRCRRRRDR